MIRRTALRSPHTRLHRDSGKSTLRPCPTCSSLSALLGCLASVGEVLPQDISRLVTLVRLGRKVPGLKKRDLEDGVVSYSSVPRRPRSSSRIGTNSRSDSKGLLARFVRDQG